MQAHFAVVLFWWCSVDNMSGETEFIWHIALVLQLSNLRELVTAIVAIKGLAAERTCCLFPEVEDHALVWLRSDNSATVACVNV